MWAADARETPPCKSTGFEPKLGNALSLMGRVRLNRVLDARMVRAAFEGSEAGPVRGGHRDKLVCKCREISRVSAIRVVDDTI